MTGCCLPYSLGLVCLCSFVGLALSVAAPAAAAEAGDAPQIVSVKKIWDQGGHNAFTDLIRFQGRWFCSFREARGHVKGDGKIRVIVSDDADTWSSAALLAEEGVDLRDPKLSVTPKDQLMVVAGGSVYRGGDLVGRRPRVALSEDGTTWTPTQRVCSEGEWLWRVTWHKGRAYGVAYSGPVEQKDDWTLELKTSEDGLRYEPVARLAMTGRANETTLRFLADDRMVALVRREGEDTHACIGVSAPPYTEWSWHETVHRIGGPNFIVLPDGAMWAGGRHYPGGAKTVLARMTLESYEPVLTLPSGGDTSYPGFVWHEGLLRMSYYASHEGKTSVYLATIKLPE